jgi:hypothetical protein
VLTEGKELVTSQTPPLAQPAAILLIGASAAERVEISVFGRAPATVAEPDARHRLAVEVEIAAGVFAGRYSATFRSRDFAALRDALRAVLSTTTGEARFTASGGQLALRLSATDGGGIALEGAARHPAGGANMLAFAFTLDRTRLVEPLRQLDAIVVRFPPAA